MRTDPLSHNWVTGKENGLWGCLPAHFISCYNNWPLSSGEQNQWKRRQEEATRGDDGKRGEKEKDVLPVSVQQSRSVCNCLVVSVVVFGTRSTVKLKPLLRTVPLMWQATKWWPVISLHLLAVVLYNQTLTHKCKHTPLQLQRTQTIHVPN